MHEFLRYSVVGGISFLVDFLLLYLLRETICADSMIGLYLAAFGGFMGGIVVNTWLSIQFVFRLPEVVAKRRGRNIRDLSKIIGIGILGLLLTELGMFLGVELLQCYYLWVKVIVAGVVMVWNYGARKIWVFC